MKDFPIRFGFDSFHKYNTFSFIIFIQFSRLRSYIHKSSVLFFLLLLLSFDFISYLIICFIYENTHTHMKNESFILKKIVVDIHSFIIIKIHRQLILAR